MALALLLTPIAFMLKIPYVIPVAYGLMSVPVSLAAISCGTIIYYIMQYVKKQRLVWMERAVQDYLQKSQLI